MNDVEFRVFLTGLLFFAKMGDNISTLLITPELKLETNPVVRKYKRPFVWGSLVICIIPWVSREAGAAAIPIFLLVAANNFSGLWFARALGEDGLLKFYTETAAKGSFTAAVTGEALRAVFLLVLGGTLVALVPYSWATWFGVGIMASGPTLMLHHVLFYRGMFRRARDLKAVSPVASIP